MKIVPFKYLVIACAACLNSAHATSVNSNGSLNWNFISGKNWPEGYNKDTGKPQGMVYNQYPKALIERINAALPESHVNYALLTDDEGSNITLNQEADVFVSFIHEGAGYLNSLCYFTFDKANPPTKKETIKEIVIFPNLSYPHMASGHQVNIGHFPAGTSIGFCLAANGFSAQNGVKASSVPMYYSLKGLNPEVNSTLRQHNVLISDAQSQEVILGFEDLLRTTGDNDFNDAVIGVKSNPAQAIITDKLAKLVAINDRDGDGTPDASDQMPDDSSVATFTYFPAAASWTTLAFEDSWPQKGDYDFNDLVLRERYQTLLNTQGKMTGFTISGSIDARGGAMHNGFALRLLQQKVSLIKSAKVTVADKAQLLDAESKQTNPVFLLWNDSVAYTATGETGSCSHFNTVKTCATFAPVPYTLEVRFNQPIEAIPHSNLDFFIFKTDFRGREIHFADYPPTDRFDKTQFAKFDDTSSDAKGRYFRTAQNLPWAIKINAQWRYPREYIDVVWAYPDFEAWVESSGNAHSDWYKTSTRINNYY
jgi:LruC domain-containing protein